MYEYKVFSLVLQLEAAACSDHGVRSALVRGATYTRTDTLKGCKALVLPLGV